MNRKTRPSVGDISKWKKHGLWLVGLPLAVASVFMWYPAKGEHGQNYRLFGIPFVAYTFDDHGADYVGILTPFFMLANAVFWFLIPQFLLWAWQII